MFILKEIVKATGGRLLQGDPQLYLSGVSTDTRAINPQNVFIAIKGDRFDGHDYLKQSFKQGAVAAVISNQKVQLPAGQAVVLVPDTIKAFGQIARWHRDRFKIPIIAITGSAGKTTTKELTAEVLATQFNVLKNFSTHNNHIGVPQTLLKLNHSHEVAVVECGTNQFGDIRWLATVANPTIVVFTNIGESHLENLKSPAGVFREKFDLVRYKDQVGQVIFNNDDALLKKINRLPIADEKVTYGIFGEANYRATQIKIKKSGLTFHLHERGLFQLTMLTYHHVYNALAAIACGDILGVSDKNIKRALKNFTSKSGRQHLERVGEYWLLDDSYNANPVSFRSALDTLQNLRNAGRKIVVCSDMLELGEQSRDLHFQMGKLLSKSRLDLVLSVGTQASSITEAIKQSNKNLFAFHHDSLPAVHQRLAKFCRPGDAILVKGSRGMRLERTVAFIKEKIGKQKG